MKFLLLQDNQFIIESIILITFQSIKRKDDAFVLVEAALAVLDDMAERLEQVRNAASLSQEAFSKRLGISRGAYQHYSKGGREIPSSVLDALLREFDVDPYWMLRGDDKGASTEKERILVENATRVSFMLIEAYKRQNVKWDEEKLVNATLFASFYLFNKRKVAEDCRMVIENFSNS